MKTTTRNIFARIFYLVSGILIAICSHGQEIQNLDFRQIDKSIELTWQITKLSKGDELNIKIYYRIDGGTYIELSSNVSGYIGKQLLTQVPADGTLHCKSTWDVLKSLEKLQGDLEFKVKAVISKPSANYTETYAGLNMEMIFVKGGTFKMGCTPPGDKDCEDDEKPQDVILTDFYMAKTEVTNAQFCKFLNAKGNQTEGGVEWIGLSGSYDDEKCRIYKSGSTYYVESGYDNYPVIYVSWYGARAFAQWLSEQTGKSYRLPTEAQWEYAARSGGKNYKYSWGNGNPTKANGGNIADETANARYSSWTVWQGYTDGYVYSAPVNSFGTNELGLADMSGNVWEWCMDVYAAYSSTPATNPCNHCNNSSGAYRVYRGGGWDGGPQYQRCCYRYYFNPSYRYFYLGFRLCRMN